MNYRGKVVWITGASSGIGEALAYAAAEKGAKLILSDISESRLNEVCLSCKEKGGEALPLRFDLSDPSEVEQSVPLALEKYGRVDVLINNGGISQRSLTHETDLSVVRRIMEINFFSGVILTKKILPYMLEQGGGHIAVTSSITGKFGWKFRSSYSASKHAVLGFYTTLGIEARENNIYVTVAMPGRVQSNISKNSLTKDGSAYGKMDPGQDGGIPARVCAEKYLKAISKGKREALIGGKELIIVHIRRFVPRLFYRIASKMQPN